MAINYRPLQVPGFGGINSGFAAGTNTIANGAELLTRALQGAQNQRIERYNLQKDFNTNEVLKAISGQTTLEGLAQAQKDGLFDTSRFGNVIDQAKIDAALRNQDNVIRKELMEAQQFEDAQRDRNDKPLLAQFGAEMRGAKSEADIQRIAERARQAGLSDLGFNSLVQTGTSNFRDNWRFNNDVADRGEVERGRNLSDANGTFLSQVSNKLGDISANELNGMVERHIADNGLRPEEAESLRQQAQTMYRQGTSLNQDSARIIANLTAAEQERMTRLERDNPALNPVAEFDPNTDHTTAFWEEIGKEFPEGSMLLPENKSSASGETLPTLLQTQIDDLETRLTEEARKVDPQAPAVRIPGQVLRKAKAMTGTIKGGWITNDRFQPEVFGENLERVMAQYQQYLANTGKLDIQRDAGRTAIGTLEQQLLEQQRQHLRRGK